MADPRSKRTRGRRLQRIRHELLVAEPWCRLCLAKGERTLATQIDHIVPLFKGGKDEPSNRQPLCEACHGRKTVEERGGDYRGQRGCDASGFPLDDDHPWNR